MDWQVILSDQKEDAKQESNQYQGIPEHDGNANEFRDWLVGGVVLNYFRHCGVESLVKLHTF